MFENFGSLSLMLPADGETRTTLRTFLRCDARDLAVLRGWPPPPLAASVEAPRLKVERRSLMSSVELWYSNDEFFPLLLLLLMLLLFLESCNEIGQ